MVPSGSCTAMVTHHFAELFHKEPETLARVHALEKKVCEFSTFLTEVAGVEDVGARFDDVVTFHDGCHALRELGIKSAPRRLLANVRGLELREMLPAEECCGFGGTFSVKFAELSGAMARTKIEAIERTGAQHRGLARPELPDADSGRAFARAVPRPHHAPGRSPGEPLTMSVEFDQKIHDTLADANLQLAIYTATGRLKEKRIEATADDGLPDYQELRTQANALKKHAIENLDHYLEEFERNVEAHGGKVVYCKDGTEVSDFVLALAKERGAQLIVKSKSMTTEEVDLNERLEHHGLESVETDLGEYILQLAHEKPYHIVAPALHKTRYDVAEIFTRRAARSQRDGASRSRRRSRAPCCARSFWRPTSASAARISWWPIPGAVVIVENEGNARLTTSAPKIHIAVAGIEKVIPRAQDLAVFLKLLARSATGQLLSVYTSFLSGPRRPGRSGRAGGVLRGAARQRPHQAAARPQQAAVALLHPLRRLPEYLPGVPQDRRPQLSRGSTPVRSAPSSRRSSWAWRTSPGCRSHPACAARAAKSARSRSTSRRSCWSCARDVKKSETREKQNRLEKLAFRRLRLADDASAPLRTGRPDGRGHGARGRRRLDPQRAAAHERRPGARLAEPARPAAAAFARASAKCGGAADVARQHPAPRPHRARPQRRTGRRRRRRRCASACPKSRWKTRIASMIARVEALAGKTRARTDDAAVARVRGGGHRGKTAVASNSPYLAECGITALPGVRTGITRSRRVARALRHASMSASPAPTTRSPTPARW